MNTVPREEMENPGRCLLEGLSYPGRNLSYLEGYVMGRVQKNSSYFIRRGVSKPNYLWVWRRGVNVPRTCIFLFRISKKELNFCCRISRNCENLRPCPGAIGYPVAETRPGSGGEHCEVEEWGPRLWGSPTGWGHSCWSPQLCHQNISNQATWVSAGCNAHFL